MSKRQTEMVPVLFGLVIAYGELFLHFLFVLLKTKQLLLLLNFSLGRGPPLHRPTHTLQCHFKVRS